MGFSVLVNSVLKNLFIFSSLMLISSNKFYRFLDEWILRILAVLEVVLPYDLGSRCKYSSIMQEINVEIRATSRRLDDEDD